MLGIHAGRTRIPNHSRRPELLAQVFFDGADCRLPQFTGIFAIAVYEGQSGKIDYRLLLGWIPSTLRRNLHEGLQICTAVRAPLNDELATKKFGSRPPTSEILAPRNRQENKIAIGTRIPIFYGRPHALVGRC